MSLDMRIRDEGQVLVPLDALCQRLSDLLAEINTSANRSHRRLASHIGKMLIKLSIRVNKQRALYMPLELKTYKHKAFIDLMRENLQWSTEILRAVGLTVEDKEPSADAASDQRGGDDSGGITSVRGTAMVIKFVLQLPSHAYLSFAEIITLTISGCC